MDFVCQRCDTALRVRHCPRLREVVLDRCFNVKFVIKGFDGEEFSLTRLQRELSEEELGRIDTCDMVDMGTKSLQKLFIKDFPDLVDINSGIAKDPFPELKDMQVINCPLWHGFTWNHGGKKYESFTLNNGWAFPTRIAFSGHYCVMPQHDQYPSLPSSTTSLRAAMATLIFMSNAATAVLILLLLYSQTLLLHSKTVILKASELLIEKCLPDC